MKGKAIILIWSQFGDHQPPLWMTKTLMLLWTMMTMTILSIVIMPSKMEVATLWHCTKQNKRHFRHCKDWKDLLYMIVGRSIPCFRNKYIYISSSASSSWPFNSWLQFMPQAGRLAVKCRHCYPFSSSHDTRSRSRGMEGYQKSLQYCGCTAESQLLHNV